MDSHFLTSFEVERASFGLKQALPLLAELGEPMLIAEGFSSVVFSVGDVILRVAKNAEATLQQVKEVKFLPLLQPRISLSVPQPEWYLEPSEYFPFGAMGYPIIAGRPFDLSLINKVDLEQVAFSLAMFLLELHKIGSSVQVPNRDGESTMLWVAVKPTLQSYLSNMQYGLAEAWWHSYSSRSDEHTNIKLVHGDLWGENIILNDSLSKVVGIIDFELLTFGDMAQDFSPHVYVSQSFANMVSSNFKALGGQSGENFERRVHDWSILRELRGLRYALSYPESDELEDSLQKVAQHWSNIL